MAPPHAPGYPVLVARFYTSYNVCASVSVIRGVFARDTYPLVCPSSGISDTANLAVVLREDRKGATLATAPSAG